MIELVDPKHAQNLKQKCLIYFARALVIWTEEGRGNGGMEEIA